MLSGDGGRPTLTGCALGQFLRSVTKDALLGQCTHVEHCIKR